MAEFKTDILIIGSGPAGCSAGIYASRAGLSALIVSGDQIGGQLIAADMVENYCGFDTPISGADLSAKMQKQAENLGVKFVFDTINEVDFANRPFVCSSGRNSFVSKAVIIATGASSQWLGLKNEKDLIGHGVSICATCDGFFYKGKNVAVIGGGNAAIKKAIFLTSVAANVTVIHRRGNLRADKIEQERAFANRKIKFEWDSVAEELIADGEPETLRGIKIKNLKTDEEKIINVDAVFLAIGHKPNTDIFKRFLELDDKGYIVTKGGDCRTNIEGVFAAGDVKNPKFRQAIVSAGSGCIAALQAEEFVNR